MKKVVHLIFTLEVGGSENMLVDIANEQTGYADVTIILINNKFNEALIRRINPGVQLCQLKRQEGNKRSIKFLLKLWILLLRIRPDVIHCHNHQIIRLLPFFRQRAVLTVHSFNTPTVNFNKYKRIYSVSQAVASEVENISGIKSAVVINGINFREINAKSSDNKWYLVREKDLTERLLSYGTLDLNAIGAKSSSVEEIYQKLSPVGLSHVDFADKKFSIRLVQIARLTYEIKGQDLLLIALRRLLDTSPRFSFTVDFIGSGKSDTFLRKMTSDLGLDRFVSFLGDRSRSWIYSNLRSYDILVHPSRFEGFGLALIEGIAAGLPVIASNAPGPTEILSDKPTGYLFSSGDALDLAHVIQTLSLQLSENSIQHLCAISRSLANEQYSIRQTAREYMEHYSCDLR